MSNAFVEKIDEYTFSIYLSKQFYEREAVFHAAYKFQSLFYIKIEPYAENQVSVTLSRKIKDTSSVDVEIAAKEFCNEVIDQQLRLDINKRTEKIRSYIYQKAFAPIVSQKEKSR